MELKLILESIKVAVGEQSVDLFSHKVNDKTAIDWEKLDALVRIHGLVPIFYEACKQAEYTNEYVKIYKLSTAELAIKSIVFEQECLRVIQLLKENTIIALPYKGVLFLNSFYQGRLLRSMNDIDIVVQEHNATKALQVLLSDQYQFSTELGEAVNELTDIIDLYKGKEISLSKKTPQGLVSHLDFHWNLTEKSHLQYDFDQIFSNAELKVWGEQTLLLPGVDTQLLMLLNHHGSRNRWDTLKYLVDLWMFVKTNGDNFHTTAKSFKLFKVYNLGLAALNKCFGTEYEVQYKDPKALKRILNSWQKENSNVKISKLRIKNLILEKRLIDTKVNWLSFLYNYFKLIFGYGAKKPVNSNLFSGRLSIFNKPIRYVRVKIWEIQAKYR